MEEARSGRAGRPVPLPGARAMPVAFPQVSRVLQGLGVGSPLRCCVEASRTESPEPGLAADCSRRGHRGQGRAGR